MSTIYFDLDGTLADLYGVTNWLDYLCNFDPTPYAQAAVMHNMSLLARYLNVLQKAGYKLGIISWLSRSSTPTYDAEVTQAKLIWLRRHLSSVSWDEIHIVSYGTPKDNFRLNLDDILFDDEQKNRDEWRGVSYPPNDIFTILKELAAG